MDIPEHPQGRVSELGDPFLPGLLSPSVSEADRREVSAHLHLPTVLECRPVQGTHGSGMSRYGPPLSPAASVSANVTVHRETKASKGQGLVRVNLHKQVGGRCGVKVLPSVHLIDGGQQGPTSLRPLSHLHACEPPVSFTPPTVPPVPL